MSEFPTIKSLLGTIFNTEDGLSEDVSIRLYRRALNFGDCRSRLAAELQAAFSSDATSWKQMLCNEEYEVADFETESEAREHARKILWDPLFGGS